MKITFKKEMLLLCINRSLGCVSNEKTYEAMEGILLSSVGDDKCQISAYDLEKELKQRSTPKLKKAELA